VHNTLKRALIALTCTNVTVLNIPTRHDLIKECIVNKESKYDYKKYMQNVSRTYHTRHGQHLNTADKEYIVQEIRQIIEKNSKSLTKAIALGDLRQAN
jgi:hypothetical protein